MEHLADFTAVLARNKQLGDALDYLIHKINRAIVPPDLARFHAKAAIGAVTTTTLQPELRPLVDAVRPLSALGQIDPLDAPLFTSLPVVVSNPTAYWVGQAEPTPHTAAAFSGEQLQPTKIAAQIAVTRETLKAGDPKSRALVLALVTQAMIRAEDTALLSTTTATPARPAGLLEGIASSGAATLATLSDVLARLGADVANGNPIKPRYVASFRGAGWLQGSGLHAFAQAKQGGGGNIGGVPLIISPAAANRLVLVDAFAIAAFDGGLEIETSENAAVQMADTPTAGASPLVSAFQTNAVVLRALHFLHWIRLRSDAAAYLELPIDGSPA